MKKVYLNLTNGLEFIKNYPDAHFIRIQSSHCESQAYNTMLMQLDSDFLMRLAIGDEITIIDAGENRKWPKALRTGVLVITYILERIWFDRRIECYPISKETLNRIFESLDDNTRIKLKYFKKFLLIDKVNICIEGHNTKNDGKYEYYKEMLINFKNE